MEKPQTGYPKYYAIAAMIWGIGIAIAALLWLLEAVLGVSIPSSGLAASIVPPMVVGQILGSKHRKIMPKSLRWRATIAHAAVGAMLIVFLGMLEFTVFDGTLLGLKDTGVALATVIAVCTIVFSVFATYYLLLWGERTGTKVASGQKKF